MNQQFFMGAVMFNELKYWYLKGHKLFRNLSFSEINQLCILTRFKHSHKSEIIEFPHTGKPRIYLLKKGILKLIQINEVGEEVVKELLYKGDIFGELDFNEGGNQDLEYVKVASHDAFICTFYREDLEQLMLRKPEFAISYIKIIGLNFKRVKNNYNNVFFKDARSRLLLFLYSLMNKEEVDGTTLALPNYLTQKDIAQLICTTRQTVIHLLRELEKEQLLSYTQKEIVLLNVPLLKKMAENVK